MWTDTLLRPTASVVSAGSTASVTVAALPRRTLAPVQHFRLLAIVQPGRVRVPTPPLPLPLPTTANAHDGQILQIAPSSQHERHPCPDIS